MARKQNHGNSWNQNHEVNDVDNLGVRQCQNSKKKKRRIFSWFSTLKRSSSNHRFLELLEWISTWRSELCYRLNLIRRVYNAGFLYNFEDMRVYLINHMTSWCQFLMRLSWNLVCVSHIIFCTWFQLPKSHWQWLLKVMEPTSYRFCIHFSFIHLVEFKTGNYRIDLLSVYGP